jgi:uncharacterized membrane protein YdbT with pleckstrin-like domain
MTRKRTVHSRALLAGLIALSTALFVIGAAVERASTNEQSPHTEQAREAHEADAHPAEERSPAHEEDGERLLGVDAESTGLVTAAAALSLLLAAAVQTIRTSHAPLTIAAIAMFAFAALDIREVAHQLDGSRGALAVLAATVATLHLSAAALSARLLRRLRLDEHGNAHSLPT